MRVARVQIHYTFSVGYLNYEEVEIEWGLADRAQDVPTLVTPRSGWHMVTSGTFFAVDRVREPNVYVVLPKELLTKGLFKPMRMEPLDDSIPEPREDPQAVAAVDSWPGFLGQEHAAKNNFHTIINQDDSRVAPAERCDYRNKRTGTNGEPWLYDRSSAMFMLYFRSGFLKPLREAVRSTQFYFNHIDQDGFLNLKDEQDPKYSYNECLAYSFWLTGDNLMRTKIGLVVQSQKDVVSRWSPSLNFWTERHAAFKLLANVVAFEVLGSAGYRTNVRNITQDFVWHQNGAGGQIPEQRIDGGLYHYGRQHAEDWAPDSLGASPWMTALLLDAVVRAYAFLEGPDVADFIRRTGTFEKAGISVTGEHPYDNYEGQLSVPIYAALLDGTVGTAEWEDAEHALDVKSALCWAAYFAKLTGYADPSLKEKAQDLYFTYDNGVRYWIRPDAPKLYGKPAFRVTPWCKYGWEHRISPSNSWIMNQL